MKKTEVTALLIKEGWLVCKQPSGKHPYLLIHPTKYICYYTGSYYGPQKSFYKPTKGSIQDIKSKSVRAQIQSNPIAYEPTVFRYFGVGTWTRLRAEPSMKLLIDSDNFAAFNYGV